MTVRADHLVVACNVLADSQVDQITDRSMIYAKIRSETGVQRVQELFRRAVALNATLGDDGVANLLGIMNGDTVPQIVLEVASRVPLRQVARADRRCAEVASEFDRASFVEALRARWH